MSDLVGKRNVIFLLEDRNFWFVSEQGFSGLLGIKYLGTCSRIYVFSLWIVNRDPSLQLK